MEIWSPSLRAALIRFVAGLLVAPLFATAFLAPIPAAAQDNVIIPAEAMADESLLQQVLQRGYELEAQQRWSEALYHYEEAVRDYPQRGDLQERLTRARVHHDLSRRYEDGSFTGWVERLSEREAIDIYSEVLRKIESHYVRQPDWHGLTKRGVDNLIIALTQPAFRQVNSLRATDSALAAFSDQIRRRMEVTKVNNLRDASDVATTVSRLASEQLGLHPAATILEFTCGSACTLDQYSCFLTSGQLEDVFSQIEGNFVGLGIELKAEQHALLIVDVIPGGPAYDAGMKRGDRIVEVDHVSMASMTTDEGADLLKGLEGSSVQVAVQDEQGQIRRLQMVRRRIDVPSVENAEILDPQLGIAYLRLAGFQKTTIRDFDAALWDLHRQGMKCLLIDLRGNPGGLLTASVDLADKFVSSGTIVSTRGRNAHEDFDYTAHPNGTWNVPLVVLIDGDTASASEIFAGAIRDHHRGTVVGQRSYGKGSVQGIFKLHTTSAGVRLTTAKFYSPSGQAISQRGVFPDVAVRTVKKPVSDGSHPVHSEEDPVLKAALQVARNNFLTRRDQ
jgi:carboxyl-terminal processing protease